MRVAITGTSGFVVDALVPYLKKNQTWEVKTISVRGDTLDFRGTDVLVHVAGLIPGKEKCNDEYYQVNFELTKKICELAKNQGVGQFVYFSTIAVYGSVPRTKSAEGFFDVLESPSTPYGESKLFAEKAILRLQDEKYKVSILRVPDVYGEKNIDYLQRYINIMNKYKHFLINPRVYEDCKRSAIHIDNLCSCVESVIQTKWGGIMIPHDAEPLSTFEYVTLLAEMYHIILIPSRLAGSFIKLVNRITGKFEFFYGRFDASLDRDESLEYQIISARDGCKKALNEFQPDHKSYEN